MHKILIIEDQKIVLDGIANTISMDKSFKVVGKLTDAALAFDFVKNTSVDLILSDICTENGHNFLECIEPIKRSFPEMKIIVMTGLPEISFVERAKLAGADSFVYKNISSHELISALKSTLDGYTMFPNQSKADHSFGDLNQQETTILRLVCEGLDRKNIATKLCLTENSVKAYITNILSKTGFTSIAQLAIFAVSNGFIFPRLQ